MPDLVSPLIPDITDGGEAKKLARKAGLLLGTYGIGITVARKFPVSTTKIVGFATGLEVVPGKGIKLKPLGLPTLMLPQPIGVVPPDYYGLPNIYGDPIEAFNILRKAGGMDQFNRRVDSDYAAQHAAELARFQQMVGGYNNEQILELAALQRASGAVSAERSQFKDVVLTEGRRRGIIDLDPARPGFRTGPSGEPFVVGADGIPRPVLEAPSRLMGSIPIIEVQAKNEDIAILRDLNKMQEFARLNPPDP